VSQSQPNFPVRVVTDSASCLPSPLLQEYGILVVPFQLVLDGRVMRDGVDITAQEFYHWQETSFHRATTSQPALGDFVDVYQRLAREASGIVSVHVARELTGTYDTALLAASMVSGIPVRVVDSRTATIAEGFVALAAARAAWAGGSLDEVVRAAERAIETVDFFACVSLATVASVQAGGRIGNVASILDASMNITPILRLTNGRVSIAAAARNRRRAIKRMLDLVAEEVGDEPVRVATFHANDERGAEQIRRQLLPRVDAIEYLATEFTPVMGAHTGSGVIGVAFQIDREGERIIK